MIMRHLKPALIALGVITAVPLGLGSATAQETTSGNGVEFDAFDAIIALSPGAQANPANVGILGGYFQASMNAFLTANGHTVSIETAGTIAGGSLAGLDALYLNRSGAGAAAAVIPEIEAFVNAGGILITEFTATGLLLNGTFSFFDIAVLDDGFFVPSGTVCGGNDVVIVSPTNGVATGLPGAWSCSGDPIGVFQLYDGLTLDSDIEIVATLNGIDGNNDGDDDPVVGTACIGGGGVVAYFSDFGDWTSLEQPRDCSGFISCQRSIQDEMLMLNSVTVALNSCTIDVMIDIKFLSNPNAYNCKKRGVLPLTIFGMDNLDVNEINIASLMLSVNGDLVGPPVDWSFADRGDPADKGVAVDGVDVFNPDGLLDLDVAFVSRDVADLIGCEALDKNDVSATLVLTGELFSGRPLASIPVGDPGIDQLVIKNK